MSLFASFRPASSMPRDAALSGDASRPENAPNANGTGTGHWVGEDAGSLLARDAAKGFAASSQANGYVQEVSRQKATRDTKATQRTGSKRARPDHRQDAAHEEPKAAGELRTHDVEMIVAVFRALVLLMALSLPRTFAKASALEENGTALLMLAATATVYTVLTGIACLFPARFGVRRPLIVVMDALLISTWINLTNEFGLFPFFYVVVLLAGLWGRLLGALVMAALCNFLYLLIWANFAAGPGAPPQFDTRMGIGCMMLLLMGGLIGSVAELRERELELSQQSQMLIANYEREIDLSRSLGPTLSPDGEGGKAQSFPHLELGIAARMARHIGGGDYFDALPAAGGRTLLCIADVSGKSARAQSRLPLLKYALRAVAPLHVAPRDLVPRLNTLIAPELGGELYIAACCVLLDPENKRLEWCNAGHIAPLLVKDARARNDENDHIEDPAGTERNAPGAASPQRCQPLPLETSGPPLGMFADAEYAWGECDWQPGYALLFYTDGLTDAFSFDGSEDGEAQVRGLAARLGSAQTSARHSAQTLLDMATAVLDSEPPAARRAKRRESLSASLRTLLSGRPAPTNPGLSLHRDDITVAVARFKDAVP